MDTLLLRKYRKADSLLSDKIDSLKGRGRNHNLSKGNPDSRNKEYINSDEEFIEFFINDSPLSELLNKFYDSKGSILDNWIGVLGILTNPKKEIIKLKQLIGKNITDKEIRQVFPSSWSDSEFEWYLDKYREELSNPEIIIYCCKCGDYDCGGISVTIDRTETSILWTFTDNGKNLTFEFDKYYYFEILNRYMRHNDKWE